MNPIVSWIVARLKEPSTYTGAGVVGILTLLKLPHDAATLQLAATIGTGLAGFLGVILSEGKTS